MEITNIELKQLEILSQLLKERNQIDKKIASLLGRPAEKGHIGEFIAEKVLGIKLNTSGSAPGFDGVFEYGPLVGQKVNIKFLKHDKNIDLNKKHSPDYYLVLVSPQIKGAYGTLLPICIEGIFLFNANELIYELKSRTPTKEIGTATRIPEDLWCKAEIYPNKNNNILKLTDKQRNLLVYFKPAQTIS